SSSVELLERVLRETELDDIRAGFSLLLEDADWRAHIVAAVVASMMYRSKGISWSDQLWKRLHEGNWTSPQLCVVLSYIDRTFLARAREVIGSGGRIDYSQELGPMLSHSKRGPAGQE